MLLIVGVPLPFHVAAFLNIAAQKLTLSAAICDSREAFASPLWVRRFSWYLRGKRPSRLEEFGRKVLLDCERLRPKWLLATGIAPLDARTLGAIGAMGIQRWNYLTDDPWNPAHRARWFLEALPHYDIVFSPRRAALADLARVGVPAVTYLPFGYAPHLHFKPMPATLADTQNAVPDVVFVGGGDRDRATFFAEVIDRGITPKLYGGYWERYPATNRYAQGHASADEVRELTARAINICLVRKANRDGHVMRSFEIPACGGCMLAEDTEEHRAIFGEEGEAVLYFSSAAELTDKCRILLDDPTLRLRLAQRAHEQIQAGRHTYEDRLRQMLEYAHAQ